MNLRTADPLLRRLVDAMAAAAHLPRFDHHGVTYTAGELLEAMVLTESSGNSHARRYEPHQDKAGRTDAPTDPDTPGVDDGDVEDDASYGLMQVMGYNWRRIIGAPPRTQLRFSILYSPPFGLAAGIEVLQGELAALYREDPKMGDAERVARALARYNGGPTGDDLVPSPEVDGAAAPRMRLQAYVDRVGQNAQRVREDRRASGWREAL
jgi:hypothetical protein